MRVANVLNRFRLRGDERDRAVREIAFELPKGSAETLSELRSGLARIEREETEYDHGYRRAVLDVLAGYEAAISKDDDIDEVLQTIHTRANWEEALSALVSGAKRPADIISELHVDAATVSRALNALSELDLVEVMAATEGQDRRSKFYRLTLKGEQLVRRFERPEPMAIEPLVRVAAIFFAELATRRRVIREELEATVRRVVKSRLHQVRSIVSSLVSVATEFSLVHVNGNLLVASEMTAQNRLAQELEEGFSENVQAETVRALREKVPTSCNVFIRCAKLRDSWNQVLVEQFREYPSARTIDPQDIAFADLPEPSGDFALIYDNITLLMTDLVADSDGLRDLQQRATIRMCLGSSMGKVPDDWQFMEIAGAN